MGMINVLKIDVDVDCFAATQLQGERARDSKHMVAV